MDNKIDKDLEARADEYADLCERTQIEGHRCYCCAGGFASGALAEREWLLSHEEAKLITDHNTKLEHENFLLRAELAHVAVLARSPDATEACRLIIVRAREALGKEKE